MTKANLTTPKTEQDCLLKPTKSHKPVKNSPKDHFENQTQTQSLLKQPDLFIFFLTNLNSN